MIMRKCPECGLVWYSSDDIDTWICGDNSEEGCGTEIPPELNEAV